MASARHQWLPLVRDFLDAMYDNVVRVEDDLVGPEPGPGRQCKATRRHRVLGVALVGRMDPVTGHVDTVGFAPALPDDLQSTVEVARCGGAGAAPGDCALGDIVVGVHNTDSRGSHCGMVVLQPLRCSRPSNQCPAALQQFVARFEGCTSEGVVPQSMRVWFRVQEDGDGDADGDGDNGWVQEASCFLNGDVVLDGTAGSVHYSKLAPHHILDAKDTMDDDEVDAYAYDV